MIHKRKVAVILELGQNFDRGILHGIAAYISETQTWSVYAEEERRERIPNLRGWDGDGLIVNFDDRAAAEAVKHTRKPVVAVGGGLGWYDPASGIPYVETDDLTIGKLAAEHLMQRGLRHFAFCGYRPNRLNVWLPRRAQAFSQRLAEAGFKCDVFLGRHTSARYWESMQRELTTWLRRLPTPVGVMGCYDWRARHVLEACRTIGLRVPDDVAIIGVDNDLLCEVSDPPLSSVEQGRFQIGYTAASLLDKMMSGHKPDHLRVSIAPVGVASRQSTDLLAVADHDIAAALQMIREQACRGLHADLVAEHVGLSRSTLDNHLKECIGRTADQEIRRVRLSRATELLAKSELPLKKIAREAGYANQQYLAGVMRKEMNTTPAQYRQAHRAKSLPPSSF